MATDKKSKNSINKGLLKIVILVLTLLIGWYIVIFLDGFLNINSSANDSCYRDPSGKIIGKCVEVKRPSFVERFRQSRKKFF